MLKFDNTTYKPKIEPKKIGQYKRIILVDSFRAKNHEIIHNMNKSLELTLPNYIVARNGQIFEVLGINYSSNMFRNGEIDASSLIISLENSNLVTKEENTYYNWINEIVNNEDVGERLFNGIKYWEKYKIEQYNSLSELIRYITALTPIKNEIVSSNIFDERLIRFNGIICRSNIVNGLYDVNPLFDFDLVKSLMNVD